MRAIAGARTRREPREVGGIALFTDTLDEVNGVARFVRNLAKRAAKAGQTLTVYTCCERPRIELAGRRNFAPLVSYALPYYRDLTVGLPPVVAILSDVLSCRPDAVHVSTPGPMGLCGWLAATMLGAPLVGTYHTDFPAYMRSLTGRDWMAWGTGRYMRWFYGRMDRVLVRSAGYGPRLREMGIAEQRIGRIEPSVDAEVFNRVAVEGDFWAKCGVRLQRRLLYVGRISREKNLGLLAQVFRQLCAGRSDVALVLAGDGPYRTELAGLLRGLPAHFLGYCTDEELARLYSAADLLVMPSRTDTLGQVVLEAQACGLAAVVSDRGGPAEMVEDGVSGRIVSGDAAAWCAAVEGLLEDDAGRKRMGRAAAERAARRSLEATMRGFWAEHGRDMNDGL